MFTTPVPFARIIKFSFVFCGWITLSVICRLPIFAWLESIVFQRLLGLPKTYLSDSSGKISLTTSALKVMLSVLPSPSVIFPAAVIVPLANKLPVTFVLPTNSIVPTPFGLNSIGAFESKVVM